MAWVLIPAAKSLFAEFDRLAPARDHASDGAVGDLAHQGGVSDHNPDETGNTGSQSDSDSINEVHAIDVDKDLKQAGTSMEECVQTILGRCRSGVEKRLRYVIFNSRIWSASDGWKQQSYSGANPHDKHAHFSFRYGSGSGASNPENDTSPWGLLDDEEDVMTPEDWTRLETTVERVANKVYLTNWWGAYNATQNNAAYQAADPNTQKAWRNLAVVFRKVVGDPVSESAIIEAVSAGDPAREQAVAELAAIRADLAAGGGGELDPVITRLDDVQRRLSSAGDALAGADEGPVEA